MTMSEEINQEEVLKHMNSKTSRLLNKSLKTKIDWVRKDHFVIYEKAKKTLKNLEWIITQPKESYSDLESLSIFGDSGTGKTSIVNYFKELHSFNENKGDRETYSVAHCILPDGDLGLKGLYVSILKAKPFNYPLSEQRLRGLTTIQLENACIELLQRTEIKMLFVDEIQHALGRKAENTLNSLKRVLLISGVPLIPVGISKAEQILLLDAQLAERCPVKSYSKLNKWQLNTELRAFLAGYEQFLPFNEPSNLQSKSNSKIIYDLAVRESEILKSKEPGVSTRNIAKVIKKIAVHALTQNAECITKEHFTYYEDEWM